MSVMSLLSLLMMMMSLLPSTSYAYTYQSIRSRSIGQRQLRLFNQNPNSNSVNSANMYDNMSQLDIMNKDMCIQVDDNDHIIAYKSKYDAHTFNQQQPNGLLHRAFSVFLFNTKNELLLQQRSHTKITFPSVWSNTCCSHPLNGQIPNEIDDSYSVSTGNVNGIKAAAVRKLQHELGIDGNQIHIDDIKYITRIHYCSADTSTYNEKEAPWGEHEIDYILFVRKDITITPNIEEVDDVKYVTLRELQAMISPSSGLLWSPWFRIIVDRLLGAWWDDLSDTLTTDKHVELDKIHRFL